MAKVDDIENNNHADNNIELNDDLRFLSVRSKIPTVDFLAQKQKTNVSYAFPLNVGDCICWAIGGFILCIVILLSVCVCELIGIPCMNGFVIIVNEKIYHNFTLSNRRILAGIFIEIILSVILKSWAFLFLLYLQVAMGIFCRKILGDRDSLLLLLDFLNWFIFFFT